ncbi:MAG: glycerol-3-phosphate 1-O-acyltransferase PlsY [Fimbriimonadaceae bacterium]|nr:glycerol-3-phosphate 1-O-acyltransferase PlsY [Fimbriimonadaceae bacterium]
MSIALCYFAAYLLGSLPFGVWIAKAFGVDITSKGSGNTGATNVARTLGKGPGSLVLLLDIAKGAGAALAGPWLVHQGWLNPGPPHGLLLGIAAVVGHTASPWLRFKGGKGVATALGAVLAATPFAGLCGLVVFAVLMVVTRIVSLSSLAGAAVIWAVAVYLDRDWRFVIPMTLMIGYVFYRHRANLARLRRGEEPRFKFGARQGKEAESVPH